MLKDVSIPMLLGVAVAVVVIRTIILQFLWNYFIPDLFDLPHITLFQTFGIQWVGMLIAGSGLSSTDK